MYYNGTNNIIYTRALVRVDGRDIEGNVNGGWREVLAAYIAQKDVNKDSSRKTYTKALQQFFRWTERNGLRLSTMTKIDVLNWKDYLDNTGHSVRTRALYLVALKGFYEWAEGLKLYPNIAKDVKSARKSEMRKGKGDSEVFIKMHLTDDEGARFLEYYRTRPVRTFKDGGVEKCDLLTRARDYAMMNLMIRTGLRSVEVSRANINDIAVRMGKTVLNVQGKGRVNKDAFVVLSDVVKDPINEYLAMRPDALAGEPLFTCEGRDSKGRRLSTRMIQYIGKTGLRAIGLDSHEYSIHSLRHTAGVQILKNGGSQFDVQDVLRHASPETSQIYLESIKEERRIENAPERLLDRSFGAGSSSGEHKSIQ